jgi:hypothetical protein
VNFETDTPSLSALLSPMPATEFFSEYWEEKPLVLCRNAGNPYCDLPTLDDIDRELATHSLRRSDVRLANPEGAPESSTYTLPDGRIDVLALTKLLAAGTTIVFDQMQRRLVSLGKLCRNLESELGIAFQTNLYLSPPGSGGFKVHYDTHDVFVLQLVGSKNWELFESELKLPLRGQDHEKSETGPGPCTRRFTLRPGDLVYIPRGIYHSARAGEEMSLHATLGALSKTWAELIIEAISELSLRDKELRRALPVGFGISSFDTEELRRKFDRLSVRTLSSLDLDEAANSLKREFLRSHSPDLQEQLSFLSHLSSLTGESTVVARPNCVYSIHPDGDRLTLCFANNVIDFPQEVEPSLIALLSGSRLAVADVPGVLDLDSCLLLVRRLIEEGLLRIC